MASDGTVLDPAAFQAYTELRKIASDYNLEDELEVPQLVVVGETSAGKSMLVQNFLRFPCSFTAVDVATRCPVAYRLIHKSSLPPGKINVVEPVGVSDPSQLADHLQHVMERIKDTEATGFSATPYQVVLESADYTDFEILDVPGLVTGNPDAAVRTVVQNIVEIYVRNPRFSIVLLKEAGQILQNATGARVIRELCTAPQGNVSTLPARPNYESHMVTVQTKFDALMQTKNGTTANEIIANLRREFGETYFVNMIFDGYSMTDNSYEQNVNYIANLPQLEKERVDSWITELNRAGEQPPNYLQKFNSSEYRSLIGIGVVRHQIQQLWLRAFRGALPRLKAILHRKLNEVNGRYSDALSMFKLQDPEKIRSSYLKYISDFQQTVCRYAAYKSEIYNYFPTDVCGRTYNEIENSCVSSWNRYKQLKWRAYRSADELERTVDGNHLQLGLKLVGVRHFDRLNRIFHYLAFTHEPTDITEDGIQSSTAMLYGGLDDYDNLQKAVREWVRKHIFDTFTVGVAWLTQMYTYLLDIFRQNVRNFLLAPGKHNHIAKHTIFLNAVDLEYHKTVRPWIRKAVRAIRDICDSMSEYAHYDITARLKKLVFSIPTSIEHKLFNQQVENLFVTHDNSDDPDEYHLATIAELFKSLPKQKILDHIFGSESYLTQDRNPQTLNHHESGRHVVMELYKATCGFIIFNVLSQFNSNVVTRIQAYGSMRAFRIPNDHLSLQSKIDRMTLTQIGHIANVNLDAIRHELETCENQIGDFMVAQKLVENAVNTMSSSQAMSNVNERQREQEYAVIIKNRNAHIEYLRRKRGHIEHVTHSTRSVRSHIDRSLSTRSDEETITTERRNKSESDDEENELMNEMDETRAKHLMLSLYKRHDEEALALGLESKDDLRQDDSDPSLLAHAYVDPDTLDYVAAARKSADNENS
ncbi:hypothetical protein I4U23_027327 [Adineta vaga]|nr:hypothetical protein I4U23_027327 [Adineta vaga]